MRGQLLELHPGTTVRDPDLDIFPAIQSGNENIMEINKFVLNFNTENTKSSTRL